MFGPFERARAPGRITTIEDGRGAYGTLPFAFKLELRVEIFAFDYIFLNHIKPGFTGQPYDEHGCDLKFKYV